MQPSPSQTHCSSVQMLQLTCLEMPFIQLQAQASHCTFILLYGKVCCLFQVSHDWCLFSLHAGSAFLLSLALAYEQ